MRIYSAATRFAGRSLFAGLVLAACGLAHAASPDNVWQEVDESAIARSAQPRQIVPQAYRTIQLNRAQLDRVLGAAPMERDVAVRDSSARLTLPLPDGRFESFRVVESPIMDPELAARYPQLRTWLGEGIDDPSATVRFDLTHKGLHAQILSADGTVYVDPFQPGDVDNYIAYRKSEHRRDRPLQCSVTGDAIVSHDKHARGAGPKGAFAPVSSGANLRTYRLAMAATGEYTQALGGTVADGLAGIVTTMNRVNGIYERELSVRMVLVANTDVVIFTNGGTDPYTNENGSAMLNQNLNTLNSLIGAANFDVGHVVSTGGGGIAQLASVCGNGKARGVTGLSNPQTDQFDVDFVAHEMGHQFNGSHTFNGSDGNCSGGNRDEDNAYETGSGVTIQAYAGICGADDLQPNSEDYFHRQSLYTMLDFTTDTGVNGGGSCGVLSATGNAIPTITAPGAFTIPASTPFELAASGADADDPAANLTYIWEQYDRGAIANSPGSLVDDGGPLFRSFSPRREGTRVFPSLRYILNNANVAPGTAPIQGTTSPNFFTAELLPSTNRTMNFRATVRDNRAGGGGTNETDAVVTVVAAAGPFAVTAPVAPATWAAGSSQSVTWSVANTAAAPINAANVRILLSLDGGFTWPVVLAASEANDGSATVTVPAATPASTRARVRVEAVGNIFFDISTGDFTITGANTPPTITGIVLPVLTTRQGSPTASANIATISDTTDAAADLTVAVTGAPPELAVSVSNTNGTVALNATAACTLVAIGSSGKSYPMRLEVTDTDGAMSSAEIVVRVGANQTPTLGTYAPTTMSRSANTTVNPSAAPADANGNFVGISVSPTSLPGGGTVALAPNGNLTIDTTAGTTFGTYAIRVTANDTCGATEIKQLDLTVAPSTPLLSISGASLPTGNGLIQPNECNELNITVTNTGTVTATGVSGTLSTTSTGVTVTQPVAAFPDIPAGQSRSSITPFELSTTAGTVCFSNVELDLELTFAGGGSPNFDTLDLPVGEDNSDTYEFQTTTGAVIPAGGVAVAPSVGNQDDGIASLVAPFAFQLYGQTVAAGAPLRATTNAALSVGASSTREYENGDLPAGASGNYAPETFPAALPTLFVYWNDLIMTQAGAGIFQQTIGSAPNRQWIIEWRAQEWANAPNTVNTIVAVVFTEGVDGFEYRYVQTGGAEPNGTSSTIGIQPGTTGANFTQFSSDTASVSAGTRLIATRPLPDCTDGTGVCGAVSTDIFGDGFESTP